MKKIEKLLFLFFIITMLMGCQKDSFVYDINDDMGETIDKEITKIFDTTSYIIIENTRLDENVKISNNDDIMDIVNVICNSNSMINDEVYWVESLLWLHFYNEQNYKIFSINLFLDVIDNENIGYFSIEDNLSNLSGWYYINVNPIKNILNKYINIID